LAAASKGGWGNRVRVQVTPLSAGAAVTELALRLSVDASHAPSLPREDEFYAHVSLDPTSRYFIGQVVSPHSRLVRIVSRGARLLAQGDTPIAHGAVYLEGGREGLSGLVADDFVGNDLALQGLRLLEE